MQARAEQHAHSRFVRELIHHLQREDVGSDAGKKSLIPFITQLYPQYEPAPHHALIAEHLEAVEARSIV